MLDLYKLTFQKQKPQNAQYEEKVPKVNFQLKISRKM